MNTCLPHVIVPSDRNKKVLDFCKTISRGTASYIEVIPKLDSESLDCHNNVRVYKEKNGGDIVFGWTIWQHPKIMLEAEFHAIWKSPQNEYLDITPNKMSFGKILFLPDASRSYDFCRNKRFANRWYPLTNHKDFQNLTHTLQQHFELFEKYHGIGDIQLTEEDTKEYYRLETEKTKLILGIFAHEDKKKKRKKRLKSRK